MRAEKIKIKKVRMSDIRKKRREEKRSGKAG